MILGNKNLIIEKTEQGVCKFTYVGHMYINIKIISPVKFVCLFSGGGRGAQVGRAKFDPDFRKERVGKRCLDQAFFFLYST